MSGIGWRDVGLADAASWRFGEYYGELDGAYLAACQPAIELYEAFV